MKQRVFSLLLALFLLGGGVPVFADGTASEGVLCYSNFDMISLQEMRSTHQEYTTGDMIADSYLFAAKKSGVTDVDVAVVPLAAIRGSVKRGYLTETDAFSIFYAEDEGEYADGYPLVCAYLTGKELKLLTELDASLGPSYPDLKMSYAGLNVRFNTKRLPMDRIVSVGLSRSGGMLELIEDGMLYKVCCSLYAARQLDRLNALTKGFISITPRDAEGVPLDDLNGCVLEGEDGNPVREWTALADYWRSFRMGDSGLPEIPPLYAEPQNRKVKIEQGGFARIDNPGVVTLAAIGAVCAVAVLVLLIAGLIRRTALRRAEKRMAKNAGR